MNEEIVIYYSRRSNRGELMPWFLDLLNSQNNKCAICKSEFIDDDFSKKALIDHDHKTGKIRGLLCRFCNSGLGHFKDDISILLNAIQYINNINNKRVNDE